MTPAMLELFAFSLLLASLLLALHLPLRARAVDLQRAARTAPELGLRPTFATLASRASLGLLATALLPFAAAATGVLDEDTATADLAVIALSLFVLVPLLLAISGIATPMHSRGPLAAIGQMLLWLLAFAFGMCHAAVWL